MVGKYEGWNGRWFNTGEEAALFREEMKKLGYKTHKWNPRFKTTKIKIIYGKEYYMGLTPSGKKK